MSENKAVGSGKSSGDGIGNAKPKGDGDEFLDAARKLDEAVAKIEKLDAVSRQTAKEYALALDKVTEPALRKITDRLRADPRGKELLFELLDDPSVRLLLGMHKIIRLPDPDAGPAPAVAEGLPFVSVNDLLKRP